MANPSVDDHGCVGAAQVLSFPQRLHRYLHESPDTVDIVSFQQHGRAFRIHDEVRFRNEVLPAWFENLSWDEFLQQLRSFGFRQLTSEGPGQGAYYHEQFLRGQSQLVQRMRPSNRPPTANFPEPDFTRMPAMGFGEVANPLIAQLIRAANMIAWMPPELDFDVPRRSEALERGDIRAQDQDFFATLRLLDDLRRRQDTSQRVLNNLRAQDPEQRQRQDAAQRVLDDLRAQEAAQRQQRLLPPESNGEDTSNEHQREDIDEED